MPPTALISLTVWAAGVLSGFSPATLTPRSLTTTRAPSRAKRRAISRPMPRPDPVMIAVFPSSFPGIGLSMVFVMRAFYAYGEQLAHWAGRGHHQRVSRFVIRVAEPEDARDA